MVEPQENKCYQQYEDVDSICDSWNNGSIFSGVKGTLTGAMGMLGISNIYEDIANKSGMSDYMTVSANMLQCWSDHFGYVTSTLEAKKDELSSKISDDKMKLMNTVIEKYHTADQLMLTTMKQDIQKNTFMIGIIFAILFIIVVDRLTVSDK